VVACTAGDGDGAAAILEECLAVSRAAGDEVCANAALHFRAEVALLQGEHERAQALFEESLALARARGDRWATADGLFRLAILSRLQGEYERATALMRESLVLRRDLGYTWGIAGCLEGLAGPAGAQGQPERAAQLFGAADSLREAIGAPPSPAERAVYERDLAAVHTRLGEEAFAAAWAAGRAMPLEQAIECALAERAPDHPSAVAAGAASGGHSASPLTRREQEVAALIARGLSNRQIAEALVIAERTAHAHVGNILGKLGFASRAQVATWAVEQGLLAARPS
jgi:DNA-binding CsgD family transcriptional regulator